MKFLFKSKLKLILKSLKINVLHKGVESAKNICPLTSRIDHKFEMNDGCIMNTKILSISPSIARYLLPLQLHEVKMHLSQEDTRLLPSESYIPEYLFYRHETLKLMKLNLAPCSKSNSIILYVVKRYFLLQTFLSTL